MKLRLKQLWGLLFLLFVTVAYVVIFILTSKPSKSEVTEIFFADMITEAHRTIIDNYNKLNEGKVKVIPIDFPNFDFSTNERKEMLARLLRGRGDGIDLFAVDIVWVQRFAKWSEPLLNYFTKDELKKILDVTLESCYYEGELYALPLFRVQGILYYRDDLLRQQKNYDQIVKKLQCKLTWQEFIDLKSQIDSNGKYPFYVFTGADYEGLICVYMELLLSLDRNYFDKYGFNFDTKEANEALQLLVDFVNKYKMSPNSVANFTEVPSYEYFIKNDGMFIRGWPSFDKDFVQTPFDVSKQTKLQKAPLPFFESGSPTSIFGGWNLMVSKFSNKKQATVDFAKYLLSEESQITFFEEGGSYPVIKSFYLDSLLLKKYPDIKKYKNWLTTAVHRPFNVEYTRYSKILAYYLNAAIREKYSVKEALSQCTKDIQADKVIVKEYL